MAMSRRPAKKAFKPTDFEYRGNREGREFERTYGIVFDTFLVIVYNIKNCDTFNVKQKHAWKRSD